MYSWRVSVHDDQNGEAHCIQWENYIKITHCLLGHTCHFKILLVSTILYYYTLKRSIFFPIDLISNVLVFPLQLGNLMRSIFRLSNCL